MAIACMGGESNSPMGHMWQGLQANYGVSEEFTPPMQPPNGYEAVFQTSPDAGVQLLPEEREVDAASPEAVQPSLRPGA